MRKAVIIQHIYIAEKKFNLYMFHETLANFINMMKVI